MEGSVATRRIRNSRAKTYCLYSTSAMAPSFSTLVPGDSARVSERLLGPPRSCRPGGAGLPFGLSILDQTDWLPVHSPGYAESVFAVLQGPGPGNQRFAPTLSKEHGRAPPF